MLPEAFTGTYGVEHFARNSGVLGADGSGSALLATIASQHRMHVVGGVIERCPSSNVLFNSTVAYDTTGSLVAKYRKIHLSKVRVGADDTSEASVLQEGNSTASFKIHVDGIANTKCDVRKLLALYLRRTHHLVDWIDTYELNAATSMLVCQKS